MTIRTLIKPLSVVCNRTKQVTNVAVFRIMNESYSYKKSYSLIKHSFKKFSSASKSLNKTFRYQMKREYVHIEYEWKNLIKDRKELMKTGIITLREITNFILQSENFLDERDIFCFSSAMTKDNFDGNKMKSCLRNYLFLSRPKFFAYDKRMSLKSS